MNNEFTKDKTIAMKGIAIVLMIMHHLYAFPDRIYGGELRHIFDIFGNSLIYYLGSFGKICVSLFLFLSGYGIYISCKNKKINILERIKKLFIAYWKIFIIVIPIGFIFFNNQNPYCNDISMCTKYSNFNLSKVISDFLGITSYSNGEWWFLKTYIFSILSFPAIKKIIDKNDTTVNILLIILFSIFIESILPQIKGLQFWRNINENYLVNSLFWDGGIYIVCFWMGMIFAKDNLLIRLKKSINNNIKLNICADIVTICAMIYLRQIAITTYLDFVYVPIFIIICLDILNKSKILTKVFYNLGKESTGMWLIHSFLCYYFGLFAKIVVWPKWALLSLILLTVLSYTASKAINVLWNIIKYVCDWLKEKLSVFDINSTKNLQ